MSDKNLIKVKVKQGDGTFDYNGLIYRAGDVLKVSEKTFKDCKHILVKLKKDSKVKESDGAVKEGIVTARKARGMKSSRTHQASRK